MIKCEICGKEFKNTRALGSHMHYVHGKGGKRTYNKESKESINLREKLIEILKDVGVKKAVNTITDIFFELGGEDLSKLDELLRLTGVPATSRKLVLERYGQLIGKEAPKDVEDTKDETESDFLRLYEVMTKRELQELLIEDLKTRIEERKKKLGLDKEREKEEEKEDADIMPNVEPRIYCPCPDPRFGTNIIPTQNGFSLYCNIKDRFCYHYNVIESTRCWRCGAIIRVDTIPIGYPFRLSLIHI